MNIFVSISLLCNLVMLGCVIYLRNELDDKELKLRFSSCRNDELLDNLNYWRNQATILSEQRKERLKIIEVLEKEIEELKLERYKHISSYYKRNGGVEDGRKEN